MYMYINHHIKIYNALFSNVNVQQLWETATRSFGEKKGILEISNVG